MKIKQVLAADLLLWWFFLNKRKVFFFLSLLLTKISKATVLILHSVWRRSLSCSAQHICRRLIKSYWGWKCLNFLKKTLTPHCVHPLATSTLSAWAMLLWLLTLYKKSVTQMYWSFENPKWLLLSLLLNMTKTVVDCFSDNDLIISAPLFRSTAGAESRLYSTDMSYKLISTTDS